MVLVRFNKHPPYEKWNNVIQVEDRFLDLVVDPQSRFSPIINNENCTFESILHILGNLQTSTTAEGVILHPIPSTTFAKMGIRH